MKKIIILFSLVFLFSVSLLRSYERPVMLKSLRAMAMGDAFDAMVNDSAAFMYNPASISFTSDFKLSVLSFSVGINDIFKEMDFIELLTEVMSGDKEWDDLSTEEKGKILNVHSLGLSAGIKSLSFVAPTSIGSIGGGVYASMDFDGMVDPGVFVPNVGLELSGDAVVSIGISEKLNKFWESCPGIMSVGIS
jgi:hypothetical protein